MVRRVESSGRLADAVGESAPSIAPFSASVLDRLADGSPTGGMALVDRIESCGICLIDRHGVIQSWNRGAELLTQLPSDATVGSAYESLFAVESILDATPRRMLELVCSGHPYRGELARRRADGSSFAAQVAIDPVRSESGELVGYVEIFHDITEAHEREERLLHSPGTDELTGVLHTATFMQTATEETSRAQRFREPLSLILVDVDHLDRIEQRHGIQVMHEIITHTARICQSSLRKFDVIGRLDDARFAVLLPRANKEPAAEMARQLRRRISEQRINVGGGRDIVFTASAGIAALRSAHRCFNELLRSAESALSTAHRAGGNRAETWFE